MSKLVNFPAVESALPESENSANPNQPNQPNQIVKPSVTLLEWDAPERMFKEKPREFYRKIGVILIFFAILFLIIKDFVVIGILGVIFFAVYVFHTIPPRNVHHKVTTNGIDYASEHIYRWDELQSFYLDKKEDTDILTLITKQQLPGRIFLLLSEGMDKENLARTMNEYISIDENPEIGFLDKFISKASEKINF